MMERQIVHDPVRRRFELAAGGLVAFAEYEDRGDALVVTHTYVPPALRGQGIAGRLIQAALDFARAEKKKIVPQCSYAAAFMTQHPEYADLKAG